MANAFKRPLRKLVNIKWKETSGVANPANEEEGWMVMKSGDQSLALKQAEEVINAELAAVEEHETFMKALGDWTTLAGEELPSNVRDGADAVYNFLKSEGYEELDVESVEKADADDNVWSDNDVKNVRMIMENTKKHVSTLKQQGKNLPKWAYPKVPIQRAEEALRYWNELLKSNKVGEKEKSPQSSVNKDEHTEDDMNGDEKKPKRRDMIQTLSSAIKAAFGRKKEEDEDEMKKDP